MSTYYDEEKQTYRNFEKEVVELLAYIRGQIQGNAEGGSDDTEEGGT